MDSGLTDWIGQLRTALEGSDLLKNEPNWLDMNVDALMELRRRGWTPSKVAELMVSRGERSEAAASIMEALRGLSLAETENSMDVARGLKH